MGAACARTAKIIDVTRTVRLKALPPFPAMAAELATERCEEARDEVANFFSSLIEPPPPLLLVFRKSFADDVDDE